MSRGGILLAVALTLALSPAGAAGQSAAQPDLVIVGRGRAVLTGDGLYEPNGVGEQRNLVVDDHRAVTFQLQNDGDEAASFMLTGTLAGGGISIRYFRGSRDLTSKIGTRDGISVELEPGRSRDFRIAIEAAPDAPLGTIREVLVGVRSTDSVRILDTVRVKVTKTSTPE